ncbi:MAG: helix-turn-helix domain-containing protein [Bryobacteraceae bacterium]
MAATRAIGVITVAMRTDPYVIDTLMRDLVAHSRSAAAFLVYLQLYRHTHGVGRESVAMSYAVLADLIGLSKRSVQNAVAHLADRRLIRRRKARPTAVPVYTVLTPWVRKENARS